MKISLEKKVFLLLAFLLGACNILPFASAQQAGQGPQTSDLPLFRQSVVNCDEMIQTHRWEGDCCSLNVTAGNGCVLNVINGYCKVYGQTWTLEYTSTYDKKDCPGSEYAPEQLGPKVTRPDYEDNNSNESSGVRWTSTIVLGSLSVAVSFVLFE